ncbi:putative inner membrane protein [Novosphingobium sp. PY1]|nr:putative inner membrane protein [Novosphingobium sp. PY1]GFM31208.1 putative inner membrane protein [Novosphingobium sp. PY1]
MTVRGGYAPRMRVFRWLPASLLAVLSTPALAHGGHVHADASPWTLWQLSPEIIVGLVVVALIYWKGSRHGLVAERWRLLAFNGGLLALFVALISPVERLADHIFAVHQVEHMLLRTVAPMLIFLSRPQAALVRGLPRGVSRFFAGSGPLRGLVEFLRIPFVATVLFLAASLFWMLPHWHDLAILDEPIHYMWHISLLVTGLIFFSVIFDRRAAPQGPGLGARLAMFVFAALGNIVLGAFLTFKTIPLYDAYLTLGHMWHVSMLTDEQTGGIVMWIPGTMMFAISALVVIHRWGSEEERLVSRRMRTGRELTAERAPANRALAIGLAGFALLMLAITVSVVAVIDHPHDKARDFGLSGKIPG